MIKNILIVKNDKIGDMVMTTGIFKILKQNYPSSRIHLICSKINKPLVEKNPYIDEISVLEYSPRSIKEIVSYYKMSKKIRKEKFELGLEMRGSFFNIFFLHYLGKMKHKIGFVNNKFSKIFLDFPFEKNRNKTNSMVLRSKILSKAIRKKVSVKDIWPEIYVSKEDKQKTHLIKKENKLKKYICISPFASKENKQIPKEKLKKLILKINKEYPQYKVVILVKEKIKGDYFSINKNIKVISEKNLRIVYLLLKDSKLNIAHDGGIMHLAWITKKPTICFIPEHLTKWVAPLSNNSKVMSKPSGKFDLIDNKDIFAEIKKNLD